ncbi:MAG: YveK family protein [Tepidanaerobacteraceae bacterium]
MEEEITLRELIEIMLRGKWIIVGFTIIAVLISGILSFFIISPTYEARSTLMVSPLVQNGSRASEGSAYDTLLSYVSKYPQMSLETYRVQVTNPHILSKVIDELELDQEKYSLNTSTRHDKRRSYQRYKPYQDSSKRPRSGNGCSHCKYTFTNICRFHLNNTARTDE